jgi:fructose-1,6-bisphosphatase/inositol monophosphatase family enzyme
MSYDPELAFAKALAREAGDIMRRYFRADDIGTEWKEDNTPLTVADTAVNELVIAKVKENFPDYGVIGEEDNYETDREMVRVVDPIDGTMPYTLGIPVSTFSLGLVDRSDGHAVLGVVYDPQLDELYTAVRGGGAFLNGRPIHTTAATDLKNSYLSVIGGGGPHHRISLYHPGAYADLALAEGTKVLCLYSQVYSAAKVASGDLIGSVFGYGSPWDSAAVSLLVEEAGGVVTDVHGQKRRYDDWADGCILSANQTVHDRLLELVKAAQ